MITYRIVLKSWRDGLNKIELDKLLAADARLGLADAKRLVDRLLDGEEVSVGALSHEEATSLAARIDSLGANCRVERDVETSRPGIA